MKKNVYKSGRARAKQQPFKSLSTEAQCITEQERAQ